MTKAVYRFFNKDGLLLYVGCTVDPFMRFGRHKSTRGETIFDVCTIKIQWFDSDREADSAEVAAIIAEEPVWNNRHSEHHRPKMKKRRPTCIKRNTSKEQSGG